MWKTENTKSVKIVTNGAIGSVFVDGVEIKNCCGYEINHYVGELPTVSIRIIAREIEVEHANAVVDIK